VCKHNCRFCVSVRRLKFPPDPPLKAGQSDTSSLYPGHMITIAPPMVLESLLPMDMHYSIQQPNSAAITGTVKPGKKACLVIVSTFYLHSCMFSVSRQKRALHNVMHYKVSHSFLLYSNIWDEIKLCIVTVRQSYIPDSEALGMRSREISCMTDWLTDCLTDWLSPCDGKRCMRDVAECFASYY